jgi:hypothetical protein
VDEGLAVPKEAPADAVEEDGVFADDSNSEDSGDVSDQRMRNFREALVDGAGNGRLPLGLVHQQAAVWGLELNPTTQRRVITSAAAGGRCTFAEAKATAAAWGIELATVCGELSVWGPS